MKIGIIGAGMISHTLARLFAEAGHEVAISNSRGPESLTDIVTKLGPNAQAATVNQAAQVRQSQLRLRKLRSYYLQTNSK